MWLAQPPLGWWPLAWIALVPWAHLAFRTNLTRRDYGWLYLAAIAYWALTMQGIRHAHPAMFVAWLALAAYLAVYPVAWVALSRVALFGGQPRSVNPSDPSTDRDSAPSDETSPPRVSSAWWILPVVWVGLECVRNYFLTGVSAVMLGHTQANVAVVIQIADLLGTYGVSFLVAMVNVALASWLIDRQARRGVIIGCAALGLTLIYGVWRIAEVDSMTSGSTLRIALVGRDEPIIFEQDVDRELEIFDAYFLESLTAAEAAGRRGESIDVVVWPESMFTGGLPYLVADPQRPLDVPEEAGMDDAAFRELLKVNRQRFEARAGQVQAALRGAAGQAAGPELIVGCSVIRYHHPAGGHSGCVHVAADGKVANYYAKTHLVMFGEYIPLIDYLPWIDRFVPPGMGVLPGDGPVAMHIGDSIVSPNVCIETAVERVTINQVRQLIAAGSPPDWIVNVTNDGWFDRSSVVEHHLRCAQLVAVGCRRPVLIAANGGPTAWIDGSGRIVERLANDESGAVIVNGATDGRLSPYLRIGDWPARLSVVYCAYLALIALKSMARRRRNRDRDLAAQPDVLR